MKITWLGHSAFRIEFAGSVLIIDPFLSGSPVFDGTVEQATAGATHVALTHGHDDHVGDTVDICKSTGATLVAVYELAVYLAGKGVEKFEPGNTGGTIHFDDFSLTFVRADHSSSSEDGRVYLGNPCGLVIKAKQSGRVLYHMGDTDVFGDMALISELHAPDIAIVPVGDRFTMDPVRAAFACKRYFEFKTVIPCHFKTFPMLLPDASGFVKEMVGDSADVAVLDIGESIEV